MMGTLQMFPSSNAGRYSIYFRMLSSYATGWVRRYNPDPDILQSKTSETRALFQNCIEKSSPCPLYQTILGFNHLVQ